MIVEKCSPGLRRRFPDANHVFRDCGLRNVDPQHAQLAVYSRRAEAGAPQPMFSRDIVLIS